MLVYSSFSISCFSHGSRNEALRVAYIDTVETVKDGKPHTEYYSKLVKADIHGKDKVRIGALCKFFLTMLFLLMLLLHEK